MKQYRDYKKEFEFSLNREVGLLQKIIRDTWDEDTKAKAKDSLDHIMDRRRTQSHREQTIVFSYAIHLTNYMKDRPRTLDGVIGYLKEHKLDYMDSHKLAGITKGL